ncbi:hypothetical protein [Roseovarius nanhaiticus]|uniref:hypothetical protein n=1 Tax=Roseovarius nanhaiticus TaxID=573024 RepID=UPI002493AAFA|nr:hypothetical protein [Roseovarius nanhaiticus]
MVSNSKILTVSYGTFSCTLEGFDDSFDTMKAIAEYFRDLAADDRYFGAEPPSPDAEMLARIAEREISRRVEAHGTDGKIHLKAETRSLPQAEPVAPAPEARQAAPEKDAPAEADAFRSATPEMTAPAPAATQDTDSEATVKPAPAPAPAPSAAQADSIADKLRRIRAVAAPAGGATAVSGFDEDEHAQDFMAGEAEFQPMPEDTQSDTNPANEEKAAEPQSTEAADAEDEPLAADLAQDIAPEADGDPVVEADTADEEAAPQAAITEAAEPQAERADEIPARTSIEPDSEITAQSDDDILSRLSSDVTDDTSDMTDDAGDATAETAETAEDEDDDLEAMLRAAERDRAAAQDEDALFDAFDDEGEADDSDGDDTLAQLMADAMAPDAGKEDAPVADSAEDIPAEATASEPETIDDDEAPQRPLAARVIKMKRADLDAALAGGDFEEEMEPAALSPLSAEAEADLQRELAEVEAELHNNARAPEASIPEVEHAPEPTESEQASDAEGAGATDTDAEAIPTEQEKTRAKRLDTPASDAQAARIFEEADSQLGTPESSERRSAIQHLRAAVAATRAERRAGGAMQADVDDQPYRNDLQTAVRPRRPRPVASGGTPRPNAAPAARPAPLKLVAEQRIDTDVAPVRPRRITRADISAQPAQQHPGASQSKPTQDAPDFAAFAEQMGASDLTELLEAAAAYMADIEGMPQFSRPMLMQKLREAQDEDFSREDGLRSFGQLLRAGKLRKLKGGRFAVTDETEYRQSA